MTQASNRQEKVFLCYHSWLEAILSDMKNMQEGMNSYIFPSGNSAIVLVVCLNIE